MRDSNHKTLDMIKRLRAWFDSFESCVVAFSAGVDSSLLALAARKSLGKRAIAVTSISPSFSNSEKVRARLMAKEIGICLIIVQQDDLETQGYVNNGVNRCYFCRNNLAMKILPIARSKSISVCVDGTHSDDMRIPRPGIKALREAGFRAPYVELGIAKEEIRLAARLVGLSNWNRPSESCLSSRIAFGQKIDLSTLHRVEASEDLVRELTDSPIVRVRTIGKKASVEVLKGFVPLALKQRTAIENGLKKLGYLEVEIDPDGYTSGKMLDLFVKGNL